MFCQSCKIAVIIYKNLVHSKWLVAMHYEKFGACSKVSKHFNILYRIPNKIPCANKFKITEENRSMKIDYCCLVILGKVIYNQSRFHNFSCQSHIFHIFFIHYFKYCWQTRLRLLSEKDNLNSYFEPNKVFPFHQK